MSFAVDLSLLVDFVTAGGDDLGFERQVAAGHADAVELQLQISLAPEVAGIFGGFEMANQIAAARESLLTEDGDAAKMAEHGISDVDGGRGRGWVHSGCIAEECRRERRRRARWRSQ